MYSNIDGLTCVWECMRAPQYIRMAIYEDRKCSCLDYFPTHNVDGTRVVTAISLNRPGIHSE